MSIGHGVTGQYAIQVVGRAADVDVGDAGRGRTCGDAVECLDTNR